MSEYKNKANKCSYVTQVAKCSSNSHRKFQTRLAGSEKIKQAWYSLFDVNIYILTLMTKYERLDYRLGLDYKIYKSDIS